jgi:membrane-associated phospholipid phosphatase
MSSVEPVPETRAHSRLEVSVSEDNDLVERTGWAPVRHFAERSVLGLVAVVVAGLGFGALLLLVRYHWSPLLSLDQSVADHLNRVVAADPRAVQVATAVSRAGGRGFLIPLVALVIVALLIRRRPRLALYLAVTGAGALILDPSLKTLVGRVRPVVADPVAHGQGNSFPSGHALGSMVVYGMLTLSSWPSCAAGGGAGSSPCRR